MIWVSPIPVPSTSFCIYYDTTTEPKSPPSKGLRADTSLWDSRVLLHRLPLDVAKTVFDVPRWRGRLGAPAPAPVCWRNARSQLHPRCNCLHSQMGDCGSSHPCGILHPWGVYPDQLLHLRSTANL